MSEVLDLAENCCEHEWWCMDPAKTIFSCQISVFQAIHMLLYSGVFQIQHGRELAIEANGNMVELWATISVHSKWILSQMTYLCNISTRLNDTLVVLHFWTLYHIYIYWKSWANHSVPRQFQLVYNFTIFSMAAAGWILNLTFGLQAHTGHICTV